MFSRTRHCVALAAVTTLTLLAAAPRADACSPLPPGVYNTIPGEGQNYPGNAAVIIQGQGLSLTEASVTVDGQPATLKDVSKPLFNGIGLYAVTVEPTPAAGQAVVITGTFCNAGSDCPPVALHYVATAADVVAPPSPDLASFSVHDYVDFKSSGGDCQAVSDFAWWITVKFPVPELAKDGVVMYQIEGYADASLAGGPVVEAFGYVNTTGNVVVPIRQTVTVLKGKPLGEAMCFRVKAYDSAGNTPSISPEILCKPCNYRADGGPDNNFPPEQPMWTPADIYTGGPCDFSTSSAGGSTSQTTSGAGGSGGGEGNDSQVIDGCGCRMAGDDESAAGLFGALALALGASLRLARRRRLN